jgi:hypothetical protein
MLKDIPFFKVIFKEFGVYVCRDRLHFFGNVPNLLIRGSAEQIFIQENFSRQF